MSASHAKPGRIALAPHEDTQLERDSSNVSSDATDKNAIAWQASRKRREGRMRRLLRQDVLHLMVLSLPSEQEMEKVRQQLEAAGHPS